MRLFSSSSSKKAVVVVIGVLATFQVLHAFDPSSPFTVQIAAELNVTNADLYTRVSPWRAWGLLPATVLAGAAYEAVGYRTSLALLSLTMLASVLLQCFAVAVRRGRAFSVAVYKASYGVSAFSFSAGFIVNCAMFSLLPPSAYQHASSANSVAMMVAGLAASFSGQGLAHVVPRLGDLLWIGAGAISLSLVVVVAGALCGALPRAPKILTAREWLSRVGRRLLFYHSRSQVLQWSAFNAVVLATHSLVKGMWKSLFEDIDPTKGKVSNGLIQGSTCAAAALCMLLLGLVPRATERAARAVICLVPFALGALFVGMACARTITVAAVLLVAYNAACECALMLGSTMMGKGMAHADEIADDQVPSTLATDEEEAAKNEVVAAAAAAAATEQTRLLESPPVAAAESVQKAKKLVDFALVFTVNAVVSIAVQDIFNALAVYVLKLSSRGWFWGFAAVSVALGLATTIAALVSCVRKGVPSKGHANIQQA